MEYDDWNWTADTFSLISENSCMSPNVSSVPETISCSGYPPRNLIAKNVDYTFMVNVGLIESMTTSLQYFYLVVLLMGIFGNLITCIVIAKNTKMHSATDYYLLSLAMSDIFLLIIGKKILLLFFLFLPISLQVMHDVLDPVESLNPISCSLIF